MKAKLIKIGNSKGLRIPSAIIKQCRMKDKVNLIVKDHTLVITACEEPRYGWKNDFKRMAQWVDDQLIDNEAANHSWNDEEWQW